MSAENDIREYAEGLFWYSLEGKTITIGVTQKALDAAGTLQEIEFPELNDEFMLEDWIAELHGKNGDVAITAPRAIRVDEVNEELLEQPSMLEDDPTGDAWIVRATMTS